MAKIESDFIGVFGLFLGKNPNHLEKIRIIWKRFWGGFLEKIRIIWKNKKTYSI